MAPAMTIEIRNMTPHAITIIRGDKRVEYPACPAAELPRATESSPLEGDMRLTCSGSDGQGGYANAVAMADSGVVDLVGYDGVDGLPDLSIDELMFGVPRLYIVSIVTAIGALAAGRGVEDLLVPSGQVRDGQGRIIGAAGLAPASSLLTPMLRRILDGRMGSAHASLWHARAEELARRIRLDASPAILPDWALHIGLGLGQ